MGTTEIVAGQVCGVSDENRKFALFSGSHTNPKTPRGCVFFRTILRKSRIGETRVWSKRDLNSRPLFIKYPAKCAVFFAQFGRILVSRELFHQ